MEQDDLVKATVEFSLSIDQHEGRISTSSAAFIVYNILQDNNSEKGVVPEVQVSEKSADEKSHDVPDVKPPKFNVLRYSR